MKMENLIRRLRVRWGKRNDRGFQSRLGLVADEGKVSRVRASESLLCLRANEPRGEKPEVKEKRKARDKAYRQKPEVNQGSENVSFLVYWETGNEDGNGFVSYDNPRGKMMAEYKPLSIVDATRYKNRKDAERIRDWYVERGGFGYFYIVVVSP